ncbi:unnamed protein product [Parascedosporium putredinis]|uniref:S-adenosyl-L-methionine-dependent methyltransferase n=1 Tax=Parascedosporium putredinis TaxID=1442378 RepID=A0A9P1HBG2_9PEZI|nr:unnamed protein product [Parascedosporium putredinis]CAI8003883.1 unnamed protein product [Parascedosporium putredinis]
MTTVDATQAADEQLHPTTAAGPVDVDGNVEVEIEIEAEDDSASEFNAQSRDVSRSPDYGRDGGSLYAPSRFTKRLDLGVKPKFTVIGDSIMEEESIDLAASTRSLVERYLDYNEENGRRYCGTYYMPNDEIEQTRLYLSHQVLLHMLDGEPSTVPLVNPKLILDIGTGTGDWATHMGEKFLLRSHRHRYLRYTIRMPSLQRPDSIDLVHMRHLGGAFRDWRFIYEQAFDLVRDFYLAGIKCGRPRGIAHIDTKYLLEAGFVDVRITDHSIPISASTGSAGRIWLMTIVDGLEASCLRPLTTHMGWDPEYAKKCCEETAHLIAKYAKDPERAESLAIKVRTVTARKPDVGPGWDLEVDAGDMYLQNDIYMQAGGDASAEQFSILTGDTTKTSVPEEKTPVESIIDHNETANPAQHSENGIGENGVDTHPLGNGHESMARRTTITASDVMDIDGPEPTRLAQ